MKDGRRIQRSAMMSHALNRRRGAGEARELAVGAPIGERRALMVEEAAPEGAAEELAVRVRVETVRAIQVEAVRIESGFATGPALRANKSFIA